jgi:DNA-3-methyladenine glycosylase II
MPSWNVIKNHLINSDDKMELLIKQYGISTFAKQLNNTVNHFDNLISSIVSQQLSTKVASTIKERLYKFGNITEFDPIFLINTSTEDLRSCGLSYAKCRSMKEISEVLIQEPNYLSSLNDKSNEFIIEKLIKLRGIGIWTAEMFQMFSLRRLDIFSPRDAGLIKGIRIVYFNKENPKSDEIEKITSKWKPYRSIGSWYMWQVANNEPSINKK